MTIPLKNFAFSAALLLAGLELSSCSSWIVDSAQNSAEEAEALAKCAEQNALGSGPANMARIRANEARAAAATATGLDNSPDAVVTAAKETADPKGEEA